MQLCCNKNRWLISVEKLRFLLYVSRSKLHCMFVPTPRSGLSRVRTRPLSSTWPCWLRVISAFDNNVNLRLWSSPQSFEVHDFLRNIFHTIVKFQVLSWPGRATNFVRAKQYMRSEHKYWYIDIRLSEARQEYFHFTFYFQKAGRRKIQRLEFRALSCFYQKELSNLWAAFECKFAEKKYFSLDVIKYSLLQFFMSRRIKGETFCILNQRSNPD